MLHAASRHEDSNVTTGTRAYVKLQAVPPTSAAETYAEGFEEF